MGGNADVASPLDRMTPELALEVRRNLIFWLCVSVGCFAAFSCLFALAVDPELSEVTRGVAVRMFGLFLGLLVPCAGLLLALAYLFDCWPAMLRGRLLREHYGVGAADLSGTAWRQSMGSGGFWVAAGRGAIVGWAFLSAAVVAWWGLTGNWSFGPPSAILLVPATQFAARSWFVRRAVARAGVPVPVQPDAAPGATAAGGA